jgi:Uma2 family endonuclease
MGTLTIELPAHADQTAFNLRRWTELLDDPEVQRIEGRIETDRHGQVITSPPPALSHGSYQSEVSYLLRTLMTGGRVLTECPLSTADGVKACDVAWASPECMRELGNRACFPRSPEICVEILSPRNTRKEIEEKKALYFNAGAREVWLCDATGKMQFFTAVSQLKRSAICPKFPARIRLS